MHQNYEKVLSGAFGLVTVLLNNLAGTESLVWFHALERFLNKQNPWPQLVFKHRLKVPVREVEVELVILTVADLGNPKGAVLRQIWAQAMGFGLELCSPEIAQALIVSKAELPQNLLYILESPYQVESRARKPITIVKGQDCTLYEKDWSNNTSHHSADKHFIFVLPAPHVS